MLIAFEGIDGSGKTTLSTRLHSELIRRGIRSHWTAEPTDGPVGKLIRHILEGGLTVDPRTLALLFAADRVEHTILLRDLKSKGYVIITDRYLLSSLAYQGSELPVSWVREINRWALLPDLVIYLDIEPELSLKRVKKYKDVFHSPERLRMIRLKYLQLIEEEWSDRTFIVDASRDKEEVYRTILNIVLEKLGVIK